MAPTAPLPRRTGWDMVNLLRACLHQDYPFRLKSTRVLAPYLRAQAGDRPVYIAHSRCCRSGQRRGRRAGSAGRIPPGHGLGAAAGGGRAGQVPRGGTEARGLSLDAGAPSRCGLIGAPIGMVNSMATRKVTLSIDHTAWALAEAAAARAGISPSAWLSAAARREAVRLGAGTDWGDAEAEAVAYDGDLAAAEADIRAAG